MIRNAPGIAAPIPNQKANKGIERAIRKTGQLHGDDRRAYEAAKAQGRGQSFMRNFQKQASNAQQQMGQEAQRAGFNQRMPQRQPQRGMSSQAPSSPIDRQVPLYNDVQPIQRPLANGSMPPPPQQMGPNIDPGFNQWAPPSSGNIAYMGGSPNFNESTGQYMNQPMQPGFYMGGSPQQFQQNMQNMGITPTQQLMNQRYGGGY